MAKFPWSNTKFLTRLPLGIVGAFVLILGVESLIARDSIRTLSAVQWEYRRARRMAEGRVNDSPILTFGDSMMKLGFSPNALKATSGRQAYNFALTATQAPAAYYLLKRSIKSGAKPSAVLFESFPHLLAIDPNFNVEHWPLLLDLSELVDLSAGHGDWHLLAPLSLRYFIPSVRSAQKIRRVLCRALAGKSDIEHEALLIGLRNWEANRGHQVNEYSEAPVNLDIWRKTHFQDRTIHPTNKDYIERFLKLANNHEIPVFWLLPPYQPALQADCERSGFDAYHEAFVRSLTVRYPRLRVIDGRHSNFDPNVFVDPHHLLVRGALVFSADVGEILRRFFDEPESLASSWVNLPPYKARQSIVSIETLDQSREVVMRNGLIRR